MRAIKQKLAEIHLSRPLTDEAQHFWVKEKLEVIAFIKGKEVFVYSSICPHMGAQMQYSSKRNELHCPWHDLKAEINSGCMKHHKFTKLKRFEASLEGNDLTIFE